MAAEGPRRRAGLVASTASDRLRPRRRAATRSGTRTATSCVVPAGGGARATSRRRSTSEIGGLSGARPTWTLRQHGPAVPGGWRTAGRIYKTTLDGQLTALTSGPALDNRPSIDAKGRRSPSCARTRPAPREVRDAVAPRRGGRARRARPRGPAASPAPKRLTDTNPQTRDFQSFPKETRHLEGRLGQDMEGLLRLPGRLCEGPKRVPLMLNVHGGPAGTHSNSFTPASRLYAGLAALRPGAGYAVLLPEPARQRRLRRANSARRTCATGASRDFEDLMKGVDALIERAGSPDPDQHRR